jgi:hypothetical protein
MLIIENGYNSSYIFTVILGLFYKNSNLSELLSVDPLDSRYIYIQEFIKYKFIEPVKNNISIMKSSLNEFRNYINMCGWMRNNNLLEARNVIDFFMYLMKGLLDMKIKIDRLNDNNVELLTFDYIEIFLNESENNLNNLFKKWINTQLLGHKYKLRDVPSLIPFIIRRNSQSIPLDIMYKIRFFDIDDIYQKHIYWNINSLICQNEKENYYVVIHNNQNKWILFTDTKIPSGYEINIHNKEINDKIMKEVVFIFYSL